MADGLIERELNQSNESSMDASAAFYDDLFSEEDPIKVAQGVPRPSTDTSPAPTEPLPAEEVPQDVPAPPLPHIPVPHINDNGETKLLKVDDELYKVEQSKHGFTLNFDRDASGAINKITTSFKLGPDGKTQPDRVYEKRGNDWFQTHRAGGGADLQMQGQLKVDEATGRFTQVLRTDIDGAGGGAKETTRTMDEHGTDTINRMDGSQSIFKYGQDGKMTEWTEIDSSGKPQTFSVHTDIEGRLVCDNRAGDIRYNPYVEDNGSVTYKTLEDFRKDSTQVITSSGDRLINGENGVKYGFDYRGDVSSIQFQNPRLFEGYRGVNRIDIGYRDPAGNQGQIIDKLTLYGADGNPLGKFEREKDNKEDAAIARDKWNVFNVDPAQKQYRPARGKDGDFIIKDGLISTTETLPKNEKGVVDPAAVEKLKTAAPHYKTAIDDYQKAHPGQLPPYLICTYLNSLETSTNDKPLDQEYKVGLVDGFNQLVPGELGYKLPVPGSKTTPVEPQTPTEPLKKRSPLANADRIRRV